MFLVIFKYFFFIAFIPHIFSGTIIFELLLDYIIQLENNSSAEEKQVMSLNDRITKDKRWLLLKITKNAFPYLPLSRKNFTI